MIPLTFDNNDIDVLHEFNAEKSNSLQVYQLKQTKKT